MKRNEQEIYHRLSCYENEKSSGSEKNPRFLKEFALLLIGLGTICGVTPETFAQNKSDFSPKSFLERIRPPFMREKEEAPSTDLPGSFTEPSGTMGNASNTIPSTLSENWTPIGTSYSTPSSSIPPTAGTGPLLNSSLPYNPSNRAGGNPGTTVSAQVTPNTATVASNTNIINGVNYGTTKADDSGLPAPFPVNKEEFYLPFENFLNIIPADQLREVRLYASRDNGNSWHFFQKLTREQIQKLPQKTIAVRSNSDGEIWFSLRVVNQQGIETPGESKQPTWRVLVNTSGKPLNTVVDSDARNNASAGNLAETKNIQNPPNGNILTSPNMLNRPQWAPTTDGNSGGNTLTAENGTVSGNRTAQNPNLVVYSVKDRGTNTIPDVSLPVYKIPNSRPVEAFQNFTGNGAGNPNDTTKPHSTAKPTDDGLGDIGALDGLETAGIETSENSTDENDDMLLMLGEAPGTEDGMDTRIRYMNQPGLSIDYDVSKVGSSGVGRVELWGTLDDGQTWTYMAEDKDCTSPVNLNLKSDGKYGFQILIFNGAGVGMERPQAGSAPQMEVVLDRINPRVQLYTIQLQAEFGDLEITWGAEDLNLGTNPVLLSWSSSTEGPWRAMTSVPLENTGRFVWKIPDGVPGKVYIRLDVCDLSKNSTTLVTGPVVTDILRPTGVILDAKPTN